MRIAVIGAGFMGLAAAWEAAVAAGAEVAVFEKDPIPGGLARTFEIGGELFECYHHFISADDYHLLRMAERLGIAGEISWSETKLGYFIGGRVVPFTTAINLLKFPGISLIDKFRFGVSMLYLTRRASWEELESTPARDWLIRAQGRRAYEKIWAHLFEMKFGDEVGVIPLSWMWARSKRRASNRKLTGDVEKFGAFTKSAASMAEAFVREIIRAKGKFHFSTSVTRVERRGDGKIALSAGGGTEIFDRVIVTIPCPAFFEIAPALPRDYVDSLARIKYAGIINMTLALDKPLTPYFWLNVSDRDVPFPGVIEMTHLRPGPRGMSLIYIPNYVSSDHPDFELGDEQLFERYLHAIRRINPSANVREYRVFKDRYADPYYSLDYSKVLPKPETPIEGVYLANTTQVYPVTRSMNNSIWWGREVAKKSMK